MIVRSFLFLRSFVFALFFYPVTAFYVLSALVLAPFGMRPLHHIVRGWSRAHRLLCRVFLGQKVVVEGAFPEGQYLFVLKHESMFETIDMMHMINAPVVVAKQELLDIPGWGKVARNYGMVGLKRETGASALRHLQRQAKTALGTGRPFCLFPEGTRVPHGQQPDIKAGFAALYQLLRLPVVPVAVNSGRVSARRSFIKRPGIITYRVGEIIPAGLARDEAEARTHAAINALNVSQPGGPGDGHSA